MNYLVWRLQFIFQSEELFQKANCEERRTHEVSLTGGSLWTHQTRVHLDLAITTCAAVIIIYIWTRRAAVNLISYGVGRSSI
jgi:hypothetical protein